MNSRSNECFSIHLFVISGVTLLCSVSHDKVGKGNALMKESTSQSRVRNKHTPTFINFRNFFQGLRSYYGLNRPKFYYISLNILRGYIYSFCHIFHRLRLFKALRLFRTSSISVWYTYISDNNSKQTRIGKSKRFITEISHANVMSVIVHRFGEAKNLQI